MVLAVLHHQVHLRRILPSTNLLVVQTFKRNLSFLSIIPWCYWNYLFFLVLFTFAVSYPFILILSLNIFSICFQWFVTTSNCVFSFLNFYFTIQRILCCIVFFSTNLAYCIYIAMSFLG